MSPLASDPEFHHGYAPGESTVLQNCAATPAERMSLAFSAAHALPGNADTARIFHVVFSKFGMIRSTGLLQTGKVW